MCLPALRELRRVLPQAEMVLVGRPWVLDVFPLDELRCRTLSYDTRREQRGLLGRWRFASKLRKEKFAAAILFQNAFDAALLATMAGIPVRAGYSRQARGMLLTDAVAVPQKGETPPHESYYYLELLRRLGLISALGEVEEIRLGAAARNETHAKNALREFLLEKFSSDRGLAERISNATLVVGIGAGASFGTAKRWPGERYSELALRLNRELGAASVFFGSSEEAPLAESLLAKSGDAAISLAGQTSLRDFIRLVPSCDLFLTNDTGTMHVAAALGVPTLAIFGPTDEHGTRPLGPHAEVITGVAECRPCKLRHCPIDRGSPLNHVCMTSITVDVVFEAARRILGQRGGPKEAVAQRGLRTGILE